MSAHRGPACKTWHDPIIVAGYSREGPSPYNMQDTAPTIDIRNVQSLTWITHSHLCQLCAPISR